LAADLAADVPSEVEGGEGIVVLPMGVLLHSIHFPAGASYSAGCRRGRRRLARSRSSLFTPAADGDYFVVVVLWVFPFLGFDAGSHLAGFLAGPDCFAVFCHFQFVVEIVNDEKRQATSQDSDDSGAERTAQFLAVADRLIATEAVFVNGRDGERIIPAPDAICWFPDDGTDDDVLSGRRIARR
jgi:hypothetical protein